MASTTADNYNRVYNNANARSNDVNGGQVLPQLSSPFPSLSIEAHKDRMSPSCSATCIAPTIGSARMHGSGNVVTDATEAAAAAVAPNGHSSSSSSSSLPPLMSTALELMVASSTATMETCHKNKAKTDEHMVSWRERRRYTLPQTPPLTSMPFKNTSSTLAEASTSIPTVQSTLTYPHTSTISTSSPTSTNTAATTATTVSSRSSSSSTARLNRLCSMPQLDTIRRVTATASACPSSVATSADCLFTGAIYFFNGKSPSFVAVPQLGSHPCSATGEIVHSVEQWLGKLALTPLTESITTSSHLLSPSLASNTTLSSTDQLVWHANDSILKTPTSPRVAPQDTPALPTPQWLPSPLLPIKDAYPWHSTTNYNHGDSNHDASSSSSSSSSTSSSNDSIDTDTNNYDKVASKHDTPWTTMEVMSNPSWTATTNTATATTMLPEEMVMMPPSVLSSVEQHHVSGASNDLWHDIYKKLSLEEDNGEQQTHLSTSLKTSRLLTEQISILESELEEHTRQQPVVQSNGLIGVSIDLHIRPSEQLERSDNCAVETLKHEYSFVCESEIRVWPTLSWRVNQPHHHEEANNNNNNNNDDDDDESTRHSMSCICTVHIHREV